MPVPAAPAASAATRRVHRFSAITLLSFACAIPAGTPAGASDAAPPRPHAGMLRYPDVSRDQVVFVYGDDLWLVSRDGGVATPLASPPGPERNPRFSADGKTIAFMGSYDGGRDLYTIPVAGGLPHRVTYHPAEETLCDWTPGGDLMFFSAGQSGLGRMPRLFTVAAEGGLPQALPLPYGTNGSLHGDGEWLAYTPHTRDNRTWKRYRGGMATDIWLFNLKTKESRRATEWEGTDTAPMWHGDTLYFLSDEGEPFRLNIWSYDLRTGKREQVTKLTEYDIKWPSMGPGPRGRGEIVFQYGPSLMLLDLATKRTREVKVTIPGARPLLRAQRTDVSQFVQAAALSPTGKRVAVEARGDLWTLPAEKGSPRNLSRTSGAAERRPAWSPDGRWIAYFSDETGEYELYIRQSDGRDEPRRVTEGSTTYYMGAIWSPDSKKILFIDKAARMLLHDLDSGETRELDRDPMGTITEPSWSHDSRWLAWSRGDERSTTRSIWLYDLESDAHHRVTSGMFSDAPPVFDRAGDWLYFASSRNFSPTYSSIDTTFIYNDSQVLVAVPLRRDVRHPWLPTSDEETWKEEEKPSEAEDGASPEATPADDADTATDGDTKETEPAAPASPIHGRWEGTVSGLAAAGLPPEMDTIPFTMTITVAADGTITGSSQAMGETSPFDRISFDESTGAFEAHSSQQGISSTMRGTVRDGKIEGTWEIPMLGASGTWTATRVAADTDGADAAAADPAKPRETVDIDLDDFEARAFRIPVPNGGFGRLGVNDRGQLLYVRTGSDMGIRLFDLKDRDGGEKVVAAGAGDFQVSGDGKQILVRRAGGMSIQPASAGASGKPVVMQGMVSEIDPRAEWRQVFIEAWRLMRDFFYVDNLHGVNWTAMRDLYLPMLEDCASRGDVAYVIGELISELNVGHAYVFGSGPGEAVRFESVGLLGADLELHDGAYRVSGLIGGGAFDLDARGPLSMQGLGVEAGQYILAVEGVPVDPSKSPFAAFLGMADRDITITVSTKPVLDDDAKQVVVRPISSDAGLRYRSWIEQNRRYVEEKSGGRVGYIYVPNTGIDGQNDLFRQFYGQADRDALIIDERWNGGGQIPTRFIELLNRPRTNYWARRDGRDWPWPPDSHQGPKCMLINGLAGSGGDMFPWLFRQSGLGKLIGTRTWGGLVGISGNPGLIDGGYVAVPTFGFYKIDGTWGVEGHGVDPDLEVIDDPALMWDGGDPQLDAAIAHMLEELERTPYRRPERPAPPDRAGMGIPERDR
ncbi:MAG: PD40 domain-containing protein [Phycisphaeraceae bacterium]|nr:PD40 domain-containing protein [Phycisphaeraceae bacterium]